MIANHVPDCRVVPCPRPVRPKLLKKPVFPNKRSAGSVARRFSRFTTVSTLVNFLNDVRGLC